MNTLKSSLTLTSKHQLTVPARVVRALQLSPGDQMDYVLENGSLTLTPLPSFQQQVAALHALTAGANKGTASDESIKQTVADYHRAQTERP